MRYYLFKRGIHLKLKLLRAWNKMLQFLRAKTKITQLAKKNSSRRERKIGCNPL